MTHEERMQEVNLAKPAKAAEMVFNAACYSGISATEFKELLPLIDAECACEICGGAKGGTPGNENVIEGVCVCDFCTSDYYHQDGVTVIDLIEKSAASVLERHISNLKGTA